MCHGGSPLAFCGQRGQALLCAQLLDGGFQLFLAAGQIARDRRIIRQLRRQGWKVVRIWQLCLTLPETEVEGLWLRVEGYGNQKMVRFRSTARDWQEPESRGRGQIHLLDQYKKLPSAEHIDPLGGYFMPGMKYPGSSFRPCAQHACYTSRVGSRIRPDRSLGGIPT